MMSKLLRYQQASAFYQIRKFGKFSNTKLKNFQFSGLLTCVSQDHSYSYSPSEDHRTS